MIVRMTPMQKDATHPAVSLVLLSYNQEALIADAAHACLQQDCPPIEIVFSDDASTDRTFSILQEIANRYTGPHRVRVRKNEANLGIGAHYNEIFRFSTGDLIVTAAGDDLSAPDRIRRIVEAWEQAKRVPDLISSHFLEIDPMGRPGAYRETADLAQESLASWSQRHPFVVGATHAFTRRLVDKYGLLGPGVWYEDPIFLLRALMSGGGITVSEPLVRRRIGGSSSEPWFASGEVLVHWYGTQSRRILAGIRQMIADATLSGHQEVVASTLGDQMRREQYIGTMTSQTGLQGRIAALTCFDDLPLGWRVRKLLTFSAPRTAASLKRVKNAIRGNARPQ